MTKCKANKLASKVMKWDRTLAKGWPNWSSAKIYQRAMEELLFKGYWIDFEVNSKINSEITKKLVIECYIENMGMKHPVQGNGSNIYIALPNAVISLGDCLK
jgi:ketopantoate reductase